MTDAQILPVSSFAKRDQQTRPGWSMFVVTGLLTVVIAFAIADIVNGPDAATDQLQTQQINKLDGRGKWSGYMQ